MRASNFKLSLRIRHPSIDPALISERLKVEATYCYGVGTRRTTPNGKLLEGVNKESFWFLRVPCDAYERLSEAVSAANSLLRPHRDFLATLVEEGGQVEYFIGWFVDKNDGDVLEWSLLEECSQLKVNLSFDVYGEALKRKEGEQDAPSS